MIRKGQLILDNPRERLAFAKWALADCWIKGDGYFRTGYYVSDWDLLETFAAYPEFEIVNYYEFFGTLRFTDDDYFPLYKVVAIVGKT